MNSAESGLVRPSSWPAIPPPPIDEPGERVPVEPVRRFRPEIDMDEWLLSRCKSQWPEVPEGAWVSKLTSFANSNAHLFVTNGRCVLLMKVADMHDMLGRPFVREVFAFSRDARISRSESDTGKGIANWVVPTDIPDGQTAMAAVYRAGREWMRGLNAVGMYAGVRSDQNPSQVKNSTGGMGWNVVFVPNKVNPK